VRRTERETGLGDPGASRLGHGQRYPKIGDDRLASLEQDVFRLQVTVDDSLGVGVVQGVGEQGDQANNVFDRQLAFALQPRAQGLTLYVRHDVVQEAVSCPAVEQRQQVGMLQIGGDLDLGQEPIGAEHGSELGLENLHRDLAVVFQVLREIHSRHAALPQLPLDAVAVTDGTHE